MPAPGIGCRIFGSSVSGAGFGLFGGADVAGFGAVRLRFVGLVAMTEIHCTAEAGAAATPSNPASTVRIECA